MATGCAFALLQHLVPSMKQPADWDLMIGHYLGVDHVGHTYDIHSPHMAAKLHQMNEHVAQVRCGLICCIAHITRLPKFILFGQVKV